MTWCQKGWHYSLVSRALWYNKNIYQLYTMRLSCLAVKNARGEQVGTGEVCNSHPLEWKGILKTSSVYRRLNTSHGLFLLSLNTGKGQRIKIFFRYVHPKITDEMHSALKHFQSKSPNHPHFHHVLHYIADLSESLQAKFFLNKNSAGRYFVWWHQV